MPRRVPWYPCELCLTDCGYHTASTYFSLTRNMVPGTDLSVYIVTPKVSCSLLSRYGTAVVALQCPTDCL